jgi:hypothetical protein
MRTLIIYILVFSCSGLTAQFNNFNSLNIVPSGNSSEHSYYGNGSYSRSKYLSGKSGYLTYDSIKVSKSIPVELENITKLDLNMALNQGFDNLLFKYKQYEEENPRYYYIVSDFSNAMKLSVNDILADPKLLNSIYNWFLPEIKKGFKLLTAKEQMYHMNKLYLGEAYLKFVIIKKDVAAYEKELLKKGFERDSYVEGFIDRRIDKQQWSVKDCQYWLKTIKKEFEPLLKDPKNAFNNYYIYKEIGNVMLGIKSDGKIALLNDNFKEYSAQPFYYIETVNDSILKAFTSKNFSKNLFTKEIEGNDFIYVNVNEINRTGSVIPSNPKDIIFKTAIYDSVSVITIRDNSGDAPHSVNVYHLDTIFVLENNYMEYRQIGVDEWWNIPRFSISGSLSYYVERPKEIQLFEVEITDTIFFDKEVIDTVYDPETFEEEIRIVNYKLESNRFITKYNVNKHEDYQGRSVRVNKFSTYLLSQTAEIVGDDEVLESILKDRKKYSNIKIVQLE